MINGRNDSFNSFEEAQLPLFRSIGSAGKRHIVVPHTGHVVPRQAFMPEVLDWLDAKLGPVKMRTTN